MSRLRPPVTERDHVRGDLDAPVGLVEFGDFECPFCAKAFGIVKAIEETLGERLCVAFRNFPIVGSHPHALVAAEAAEAAGAQGRFWEMHDMLYQHQDALELPDLEEYAGLIGLDVRRFVRDLRGNRFIEKIQADLHSGAISGVNGTPTFFVNGQRHDGSWDYDSLLAALTSGTGLEVPV